MEEITRKLRVLENIWRNYFFDYDYLLKEIKYNKELLSNYPGVVFGYMGDTLPVIDGYFETTVKTKEDCFLTTIGLLQIIYIQQDLIDELLLVFKLQKSELKDKDPNRTIRNELAGHPIRQQRIGEEKKLVLKSYSLFSYETTAHKIQYLKYRRETNFAFELEEHDISVIIGRHKEFLEKYLDLIFQKVIRVLNKFTRLNGELLSLRDKVNFQRMLEQVEIRFDYFFKQDYTFDKKYITECWKKRELHPRYQFAVDKFNTELSEMIAETTRSIIQLSTDWNEADDSTNEVEEHIDFGNVTNVKADAPLNDDYELGKLYSNHPIYGIAYFKEKYSNNPKIMEELDNMEKYAGGKEFYCSYNYLRDFLLQQ